MKKEFLLLTFLLSMMFYKNSYANDLSFYQKYFNNCKVSGSTTLYDLRKDLWLRTNTLDAEKQTLPASTFKIINSLIALEEGVTSIDEVFKWDGKERSIAAWNQDNNLSEAFKNSTVWVYEILAKRLSKDIYLKYLNQIPYGNGDVEHGQEGNFWVHGSFGVSAIEQIEMLVKLYKNELPFAKKVMAEVKGFMLTPESGSVRTYGKSGWTQFDGKHIGWWIGYTEFPDGPIFFATRLTKNTDEELDDFFKCRKSITESIINEYESR